MDAAQLIADIEAAWRDVPVPEKDTLRDGGSLEAERVAEFFAGRLWREVRFGTLKQEYSGDSSACLSFLSDEAFRYYLPAYMIISVEKYEEADVAADAALYALIPPTGPSSLEWWRKRIEGFLPQQIKVINDFLSFMAEEHADEVPDGTGDAIHFWKRKL